MQSTRCLSVIVSLTIIFSLTISTTEAQVLSHAPKKDTTKTTQPGVKETKPGAMPDREDLEKQEAEQKRLEAAKNNVATEKKPPLTGLPSSLTDDLEPYIENGMRQWQIPGLAIVIVKDGKVVLSRGYGVRELGKPAKVDENTLFIIASNTKLFTGTALANLDHEKKLSLNDKVTKFIPWFRLYDSTSTKLANIKDMLSHRIGLKTFQGDFTFWNSNLPKDSIIWKMRYLKPVSEFRQDYGYCNSAFLVAGEIVNRVTGQSWENYVQQHILNPLGMNNTYMNTAGLGQRDNVARPYNNQYTNLTMVPYDQVDNLGPATSMVSNIKDLSKWLMFQLDSGRYNGRQVLPWAVLQKTRDANIITGSRKSTAYPTHFRAYGLGLYMTDYAGRQVYWHTGGAFGNVTNVCFIPEEKLGIAILTNNDNQSFFEALRYQIMDSYFNLPHTDRSKFLWGFFEQGEKTTRSTLDSLAKRVARKNTPIHKLDEYTGEYFNTVYGKITISRNKDLLVARFQHHPNLTANLEYMDNNEFRLTYSHPGYGVHPAKFGVVNGKPHSVIISVNEFIESDSYLFVKDPNGIVVK